MFLFYFLRQIVPVHYFTLTTNECAHCFGICCDFVQKDGLLIFVLSCRFCGHFQSVRMLCNSLGGLLYLACSRRRYCTEYSK